MRIRKILIRAAIIISVLLLIFNGVLMYRNHSSYKHVIHINANNIIKIKTDLIAKTLVYNAIKNPSYYYKNKTSKKDSIDDGKKQSKGYKIPANVFLYSVKGKNSTTFFTSFQISSKEDFKEHIIKEYNLDNFSVLKTLTIATNNDQNVIIAFNDNQCVVAYNPTKEDVNDVFIDILINDKTLKKGDVLFDKLKEAESHLNYISPNNLVSLNFNNGEIAIDGSLQLPDYIKIPSKKVFSNFSENSSVKFYLNALTSKQQKATTYKNILIETDSISKYYKGNFAFEIASSTIQEDSIVTYEYNDDFEKIETFSVVEKKVPEINIQISSDAKRLYNYLENSTIINNTKLNKEIFPLYQVSFKTTANNLQASTNLSKEITSSESNKAEVFMLSIDFNKLQNQNHFPLINTYLDNLTTLVIIGSENSNNTVNIEGKLEFINKDINALAQFLFSSAQKD